MRSEARQPSAQFDYGSSDTGRGQAL